MRYTIDAMSLCKREEIARNLACKSAAGSSNFAVTVSKTQKAGTFTQKLSLPNVHFVKSTSDAHNAGSCNIFASAQSSSPACIASDILAEAVLSLELSLVQLSKRLLGLSCLTSYGVIWCWQQDILTSAQVVYLTPLLCMTSMTVREPDKVFVLWSG